MNNFFSSLKTSGGYDIAILKLYVSLSFNEKVGPICLPQNTTTDQDITVFSAGWGLRYASVKKANQPLRSSCLTDEVGPSNFKQCSGGWLSCNRIDLPPIHNFSQCLKWKSQIPPKESSKIIQILGDLKLTCYPK